MFPVSPNRGSALERTRPDAAILAKVTGEYVSDMAAAQKCAAAQKVMTSLDKSGIVDTVAVTGGKATSGTAETVGSLGIHSSVFDSRVWHDYEWPNMPSTAHAGPAAAIDKYANVLHDDNVVVPTS